MNLLLPYVITAAHSVLKGVGNRLSNAIYWAVLLILLLRHWFVVGSDRLLSF